MSDDTDDADLTGEAYPRLQFQPFERRALAARYEKAWRKAKQAAGIAFHADDAEMAGAIYAGVLQGYAANVKHMKSFGPDSQDRRREKVTAFANAVENVIDAALKLDDPALGFAIWRGVAEAQAANPDTTQEEKDWLRSVEGWRTIQFAYGLQHDARLLAERFALGVRKAIKELPNLDRPMYSAEETIARALEEYLGRDGIPFTTSSTGLAGESFHAVFRLAGFAEKGAEYWLRQARDNPNSWRKFVERMKVKFDNNS